MSLRGKGPEKEIIRAGKGPQPSRGQVVTVRYTASVKNNDPTQIYSTMPRSFPFVIGEGNVMKGFEEGVLGMKLGEVARLTCAPDDAFGADGFPAWGIQPDSVLEFEIELLHIAMAVRGKGPGKEIIRAGKGPQPSRGQVVTVHCTAFGKNNDLSQAFWSTKPTPFSFIIGEGNVIKGFDEGVLGMRLGEVARVTCAPDDAFGADGFPAWGIQPDSVLEFEIELLHIDGQMEESCVVKNKRAKLDIATKEEEDLTEQEREEEELLEQIMSFGFSEETAVDVLEIKGTSLSMSKMGLQHFNKENKDEFELGQPLHVQILELYPPESKRFQYCCHVSFTARRKISSSYDAREEYFFAELVKGENDRHFTVTSCSIMEESKHGGRKHNCMICPPVVLLHPPEGRYVTGSPSYKVVEFVWD